MALLSLLKPAKHFQITHRAGLHLAQQHIAREGHLHFSTGDVCVLRMQVYTCTLHAAVQLWFSIEKRRTVVPDMSGHPEQRTYDGRQTFTGIQSSFRNRCPMHGTIVLHVRHPSSHPAMHSTHNPRTFGYLGYENFDDFATFVPSCGPSGGHAPAGMAICRMRCGHIVR